MTTIVEKQPDLKFGYLMSDNKLVSNPAYEAAQQAAHEQVMLAVKVTEVLAKGQSFNSVIPASMEDLLAQVREEATANAKTVYMAVADAPDMPTDAALKLDKDNWVTWLKSKAFAEKFNTKMAQFDIIDQMEKGGLLFTQGVASVKLEKVYTIAEIKEAVTTNLKAKQA